MSVKYCSLSLSLWLALSSYNLWVYVCGWVGLFAGGGGGGGMFTGKTETSLNGCTNVKNLYRHLLAHSHFASQSNHLPLIK